VLLYAGTFLPYSKTRFIYFTSISARKRLYRRTATDLSPHRRMDPRFTAPNLPWWSPIQVFSEVDACLNFSERATELYSLNLVDKYLKKFLKIRYPHNINHLYVFMISIISTVAYLKKQVTAKCLTSLLAQFKQHLPLGQVIWRKAKNTDDSSRLHERPMYSTM